MSVQCTFSIPNKLLHDWYTKTAAASTTQKIGMYVELLNSRIKGGLVSIKSDSIKVGDRLMKQANKLVARVIKTSGRQRQQLLQRKYTMFVLEEEADTVQVIRKEAEEKIAVLEGTHERELADSRKETEALLEKMMTLSQGSACEANHGRIYEDVSPRQARRKLNTFAKRAQDALWFGNIFGLLPEYIQVRKVKSGSPLKVPVGATAMTTPPPSPSEDDHARILQILYIVDLFAVSDEAYHELAMVAGNLPPIHQLKQARTAINNSIHLDRLPNVGAYRPFKETLAAELTKALMEKNTALPIRVKLSGDGARLSRCSNIILLSFSLPGLQADMLAASGNHTFAAIRSNESYDTLHTDMGEVMESINTLLLKPTIAINGTEYPLEFFLGCDYKFLLIVLGLNAAHSTYACVWCDVTADERWNMSKPLQEYTVHRARTLTSLKQKAALPSTAPVKERCGVIHSPVLNIEPDHVVMDELHLLLRITDVLIRNLIFQMVIQDRRLKHSGQPPQNYLRVLEGKFREIGVTFHVWEVKDSKTGKLDCTSLMGNDKKKVLSNLPDLFLTIIPDQTVATKMSALWTDFHKLYKDISSCSPPTHEHVHEKAKTWVNDFIELQKYAEGFQRKNVTPYMHILVYHVPEMIRRYGNIKQFSAQGVEKNNDVARRNYFSSNLHDVAGEVLKAEGRFEATQAFKREKRKYTKKNDEYWNKGGIQESRKRRCLSDITNSAVQNTS